MSKLASRIQGLFLYFAGSFWFFYIIHDIKTTFLPAVFIFIAGLIPLFQDKIDAWEKRYDEKNKKESISEK